LANFAEKANKTSHIDSILDVIKIAIKVNSKSEHKPW